MFPNSHSGRPKESGAHFKSILNEGQQVELLVRLLVKEKLLYNLKTITSKHNVWSVCQANEELLPDIQKNLGDCLEKYDYLDSSMSPATYNFKKSKIIPIIDGSKIANVPQNTGNVRQGFKSIENKLTNSFGAGSLNDTTRLAVAKQVDAFVQLLVEERMLSETNLMLDKYQLKHFYKSYEKKFPDLKDQLDYVLHRFGYVEYQSSNPDGAFEFRVTKIQQFIKTVGKPEPIAEITRPDSTQSVISISDQSINISIDTENSEPEDDHCSKSLADAKIIVSNNDYKKVENVTRIETKAPIFVEDDQVNYLVSYLIKCGVLDTTENVIEKSILRQVCQANTYRLPNLQSMLLLDRKLKQCGYLDFEVTPNTFNFKKERINDIINHFASEQDKDRRLLKPNDEKIKNLEWLMKLLIDCKVISKENCVIKRHAIFALLLLHKKKMPQILPTELFSNLENYGFVEPQSEAGSIVFDKRRLCEMIASRSVSDHKKDTFKKITLEYIPELEISRHITICQPKVTRTQLYNYCYLCQLKLRSKDKFVRHMSSIHGPECQISCRPNMERLDSAIFDIHLVKQNQMTNIKFILKKVFENTVVIQNIFLLQSNHFFPVAIVRKSTLDEQYEIIIHRKFVIDTEEKRHSLILHYEGDDREYIDHYHIQSTVTRNIIQVDDPGSNSKPMKPRTLPAYAPDKKMINFYNNIFNIDEMTEDEMAIKMSIKEILLTDPNNRLTPTNYLKVLTNMVQIEDCDQVRALMVYDKENMHLEKNQSQFYVININDRHDLPGNLCDGDWIQLRRSNVDSIDEDKVFNVKLHKLQDEYIIVKTVDDDASKHIDVNKQYNLRFKPNRVPLKTEYQALGAVNKHKLTQFMFPDSVTGSGDFIIEEFEYFNKTIAQNPEQCQAIKNIVNGIAKPAPYLIFGPPGTGKTSTIVETVCQLWKLLKNSKILITAQSNAACNEVVERLLKFLPPSDVYRLFAPSWEDNSNDKVVKMLKLNSNLATGTHVYPSWSKFYQYKVVACSLIMAGRLVSAGISTKHFTHVFVDECASATEPSALVPIAGLITSLNNMNGHVILAGDTHQLGPVVKSEIAEKMGYNIPLMERLMNRPLYQKDVTTGKYDSRVITKLVRNFRSHPKIIEYSNRVFYDGDLIAKGDPKSIYWAVGWEFLANKDFPILFCPCYGEMRKEQANPSSFNVQELDKVCRYVQILLTDGVNGREIAQSEIGVISPYKMQCSKLESRFRANDWSEVEVGTVEAYQGREKAVIIITTVRSGTDCVGFLNNPKRLNVSITRAKALLIIIGNPNTLCNDEHWYDLLDFIGINGGFSEPITLGQRPEPCQSTSLENLLLEFEELNIKEPGKMQVKAEDFI